MKVTSFVIRPDVFPYPVGFWFGPFDAENIRRLVVRHGLDPVAIEEDWPDIHDAACCYDCENGSFIWMPGRPKTSADFAKVAHECVHAAHNAARFIGIKSCGKNEEFFTYFTQFLVEKSLSKFYV